jgi:hypothetical protein
MSLDEAISGATLTCSGVDYMRLWPLPVVQPWQETPDPVDGWMAERLGPMGQWR